MESCRNGRAFHELDGRILVGFDDGTSIYLAAPVLGSYGIQTYGGDITQLPIAGAGARCTVYFRGDQTADNVYLIEVYIEVAPEPDPEPEPEPEIVIVPASEPEAEPASEPAPDPAPDPDPAPAEGETSGESNG